MARAVAVYITPCVWMKRSRVRYSFNRFCMRKILYSSMFLRSLLWKMAAVSETAFFFTSVDSLFFYIRNDGIRNIITHGMITENPGTQSFRRNINVWSIQFFNSGTQSLLQMQNLFIQFFIGNVIADSNDQSGQLTDLSRLLPVFKLKKRVGTHNEIIIGIRILSGQTTQSFFCVRITLVMSFCQ